MVLHLRNCLFFHPRDLSHPMGGFFSAEDADSKPEPTSDHKKEGAFCVWTHDELQNLLQKETFKGTVITTWICFLGDRIILFSYDSKYYLLTHFNFESFKRKAFVFKFCEI